MRLCFQYLVRAPFISQDITFVQVADLMQEMTNQNLMGRMLESLILMRSLTRVTTAMNLTLLMMVMLKYLRISPDLTLLMMVMHVPPLIITKKKDKVQKRRRLKKKHPADSSDDNNDDSSHRPVVRRKAYSMFDSCSEDEDNMSVPVSLAKKENTKDVDETKYPNGELNDDTTKKSNGAKKRKGDAISQDHAPLMDLTNADEPLVSKEGRTKKKSKKKGGKQLEVGDGKHSNKIRTLEDGLIVEDLSTGNLDAEMASNGSKVSIKYVGTLQDGKIVESNVGEKPYKFKLGAGKVIRGWDVGICGMRVGDKRKLTVPPAMCYGSKAIGEVPKNSSIIYEIELVKVRSKSTS